MRRKFNDTGVCVPEKHFMADTSEKLAQIFELVEDGSYFTINRPRQYGKTTIVYLLSQYLKRQKAFLFLELSFEGIGDKIFETEKLFCTNFVKMLSQELHYLDEGELAEYLDDQKDSIITLDTLSGLITKLVNKTEKKIILAIDEIDKSSNNQLFLSFLGMLRDKYLVSNTKLEKTFYSVILAGVHDIKSLKLKLSPDTKGKLNSPWNIAIDFNVDMSFNPREIEVMLVDYSKDRGVKMNTAKIASKIHFYTSGYPYLVSKICKVANEVLLPLRESKHWDLAIIDDAFRYLVDETYSTTLFDDMAKNLENNAELYQLVFDIIFNGKKVSFNVLDPIINLGKLYGIFDHENGRCKIHNRIFEQKIYGYMLSRKSRETDMLAGVTTSRFFDGDDLALKEVLLGFQQFMKENYSTKDVKFLEREGRLLFLSYLKPIINGHGFDFKEPNVAEERRMDVVVTYNHQREVVELKRWEGEAYHQKGLKQLCEYLDTYSLQHGFLLIFDFRKEKVYKSELIAVQGKEIFAVWV